MAAGGKHNLQTITRDGKDYPERLIRRLGKEAPETISIFGSLAPFSEPLTAFLCSTKAPGGAILRCFDQAAAWRDKGQCVISGFHSPLEKQCLDILLRGNQPIVLAFARGIEVLRLPATLRTALDEGRLTIVSSFPAIEKRVIADLARQRNRFVAAMADEVVFGYVSPGGSLSRLVHEISSWGGTCRFLEA
jgi:predicted Rossmann fold nucleotide-binding protein DprA/Smf involved in DNA uptake